MAFIYERLAYITPEGKDVYYREGAFNSDETLPTGTDADDLAEGSLNLEPDTGKVSVYDKASDEWNELLTLSD